MMLLEKLWFKVPDTLFIAIYEFIEKETRNHEPNCLCSNSKLFNTLSKVAENRYNHDNKIYNSEGEN